MKLSESTKKELREITNCNFDIKTNDTEVILTSFESPSEEYERERGVSIDPDSGILEDEEVYDFEEMTVTFKLEKNEKLLELLRKTKENNDNFITFEMTGEGSLDEEGRNELSKINKELTKLLEEKPSKKKPKMKI